MGFATLRRFGMLSGILTVGIFAQNVLSVRSGLVHYVEGQASIENTPVEMKFGQFPSVNRDETLRTEEGRAELLLTPGAFLRVAEDSAIRMLSTSLSETRVEVLKGEALLEIVGEDKDPAAKIAGNSVEVVIGSATISFSKAGIFEFTANPGHIRVFEGEAVVHRGADQLTLKKDRQSDLDGVLQAERLDGRDADELYRWSDRRSGYLALANVSAAKSMRDADLGTYGYDADAAYVNGYGMNSGLYNGWNFNPYYGMYTYVPQIGFAYSPFGYSFWSPYNVYQAFYPGYYYGGGGGGGGGVVASGRGYSHAAPAYNPHQINSPGSARGSGGGSGFGGTHSAASSGGFRGIGGGGGAAASSGAARSTGGTSVGSGRVH